MAANVLHDLGDPERLSRLRDDVRRIARDMEDPGRPPPMYWTGVPWPRGEEREDCDWCLTISIGGTNTHWHLSRLRGGEVHVLSPEGREVTGDELSRVRESSSMRTPTAADTASGIEMVRRIVEHVSRSLRPHRHLLPSVRHMILGWGFPHRVVRTRDYLLGGIAAVTTRMTKEQSSFTDLVDRDIGEIFAEELDRALDWRPAVTVANDGVAALHFFLAKGNRDRFHQIGLFINGTGANFCIAEPYRVRPEGVVSQPGERYEPARLSAEERRSLGEGRGLDPTGGTIRRYLVNYEIGSIELAGTRTRFDVIDEYPIESNVLSGGNAFEHQFRAFTEDVLGEAAYRRIREAAPLGPLRTDTIEGPEVGRIAAAETPEAVLRLLPGAFENAPEDAEIAQHIARAVISRSAQHAALILAAVTERLGFGLGDGDGRSDLLALEGSVWKAPGYREIVLETWRDLVGAPLSVELRWEPSFSASARGPLYVTLLQCGAPDEESGRS
ncbi:MAG TPA: hypothetical protein VK116_02080 [Planctomycetota bacterium]|nr:hypothetical protein [Planctomycetota bacterium]